MKQDEDMLGGLQNWPRHHDKGKRLYNPTANQTLEIRERKFVRHV
jgi:hypothetical protein